MVLPIHCIHDTPCYGGYPCFGTESECLPSLLVHDVSVDGGFVILVGGNWLQFLSLIPILDFIFSLPTPFQRLAPRISPSTQTAPPLVSRQSCDRVCEHLLLGHVCPCAGTHAPVFSGDVSLCDCIYHVFLHTKRWNLRFQCQCGHCQKCQPPRWIWNYGMTHPNNSWQFLWLVKMKFSSHPRKINLIPALAPPKCLPFSCLSVDCCSSTLAGKCKLNDCYLEG